MAITQQTANGEISQIKLDDISPNPFQQRKTFDEEKLNELADSISKNGVLQPILVRPVKDEKTPYQLVAGERRWRASRIAEQEEVPALVREFSDEATREVALIENIEREGLVVSEEAAGIKDLIEVNGGDKEAVAQKISRSVAYINDRLAILKLDDEITQMLDNGDINIAQAKVILEVEGKDKQLEAAKKAKRLQLSANQLRGNMQQHIKKGEGGEKPRTSSGDPKPASFQKTSASLVQMFEALSSFDFDSINTTAKGLDKKRDTLSKQIVLVKQALANAEEKLAREPVKPAPRVKRSEIERPKIGIIDEQPPVPV